ncbi:hypothetical protein SPF06_03035 [Sinomonas sp. JGH33]|uniref:Lactococcin 972 family bacteriocin n=1 Tax=Sinomonas terricola TaxID=3110330 RepID=A0ABU5T2C6_9MICC|nr:hypothetical protein [Sinomonas sp. JGH33]MEA5453687.1 hypothetical protein [Sinomonas sp. JGH33]
MIKVTTSRAAKVLAAGALSAGLPTAIPATANAAIDGWTWNWSNWWEAHAYVQIYNHNLCRQSFARIGDTINSGRKSYWESKADASGFSWTHEAYQRGC